VYKHPSCGFQILQTACTIIHTSNKRKTQTRTHTRSHVHNHTKHTRTHTHTHTHTHTRTHTCEYAPARSFTCARALPTSQSCAASEGVMKMSQFVTGCLSHRNCVEASSPPQKHCMLLPAHTHTHATCSNVGCASHTNKMGGCEWNFLCTLCSWYVLETLEAFQSVSQAVHYTGIAR